MIRSWPPGPSAGGAGRIARFIRRPSAWRSAPAAVSDLLPLVGHEGDGRAVLVDGTVVSAYEVQPLNTLVLDEQQVEQLAGQVHKLLAQIPVGQQLSLYVQSTPLALDRLNREEQMLTARVAAAQANRGDQDLAVATRRLGAVQAHSLGEHVPTLPASEIRYFVFCPITPPARQRPRRDRASGSLRWERAAFARLLADHDRYLTGIVSAAKAMRLQARPLVVQELVDLLWARCSPDHADAGEPPPSAAGIRIPPVDETRTPADAQAAAAALKAETCRQRLDARARGHLRWARGVEQVVRLGGVPEETWLGWTQYLALAPLPFTLAVHFHARDRLRERSAQTRRYKQIWAANRGQERMGKLVAPDREDAEQEAREVTSALKRQAAATVYDTSIYLAMRDPGGDRMRLADELRNCCRELTAATDAVVNESPFAQVELWRSTLPLGIDPARRSRKYLSTNAADTWPLIGSGCGSPPSPTTIPLGYAHPGRELVRLDPYDDSHPNHVTIVAGQSGGGKTMIVNLLVGRAAAKGARGAVIDRSGHYDFAASTIPGAASVRIGGGHDEHRINPWDGAATPDKVAFLVALHQLLLAEGSGTSSVLGKLEQSLLGLAIRAVYRRCEHTGEVPRETLLREELLRRYLVAKADGSLELAGTLQLLAESLHNYVGDGPYAWLCDSPTTVAVDAPLVVYDTRRLPDTEAPAALFVICESIIRRLEETRERYLASAGSRLPWDGKFFLIFEEVWKLVARSATGQWVNELARRSRHLALWMIAISQQLDDFSGPEAQALVSQSTLRILVRHSPSRLSELQDQIGLSDQAVGQIRELQTVKREYGQAYVYNGGRGEGTVTIAVGALEYWRLTSDPVADEPLRRRALRDARGQGWRRSWDALRLLTDPDWRTQQADLAEGDCS